MDIRLPQFMSAVERDTILAAMQNLLGGESDLHSTSDMARPLYSLAMMDRPTSRTQARILAAWFGTQIANLAEHGEAGANPLRQQSETWRYNSTPH